MAEYKVIKFFTDLKDNNYAYKVGDIFPHKGANVSDKRIAELASTSNKRGVALIEKIEDKAPAKQETPTAVDEAAEEKPKKRGRKKSDVK